MSMEPIPASPQHCATCGATGFGKFCSECGAPLGDAASSARHLLRADAIDTIGLDRRILSTLRDLLLHPVRIVSAYMRGDRRLYLPPLKLFLTLGGLYMLALSFVQPQRWDIDSLRRMGVRQQDAAVIQEKIRAEGLTIELFNERFQSRMNATAPVITALALLPMVLLLRLLDRRRPWAEHFMFMLGASNCVWLVSLLIVPTAYISLALHQVLLILGMYIYLGIAFCALYPGRTRVRTAMRFALFAVTDLTMSLILSMVLMLVVYASIFLF